MMDDSKRIVLATKVLFAAILLGIVGNLLLSAPVWGLGFTFFAALAMGAFLLLYKDAVVPIAPSVKVLAIPVMLFAICLAWRDSDSLRVLNVCAIALLVGLAAARRHIGNLRIASLVDYPCRIIASCFEFIADFGFLANLEGQWPGVTRMGGGRQALAVSRGMLIAVPLVLVFGGLFMSADASFERLVTNSINIDAASFWTNTFGTIGCAWIVGGLMRRMLLAPLPAPKAATASGTVNAVNGVSAPVPSTSGGIGLTEVATVLGALILLFAVFVGTQVPYFFGSAALAKANHGFNVATWARRGFFELAVVTALALPVLLGADALLRRQGITNSKLFKVMAGVMIGLLAIVMASAAHRMQIYVAMHGVTMLRIYVMAIIGWLSFVFVWFGVTVLRGQPERFAFGGLASLLCAIFLMNVANPEGIAARIDMTRKQGEISVDYITSLSMDAVPAIASNLDRVTDDQRKVLMGKLDRDRGTLSSSDWRSWSLSRLFAAQSMSK